MTLSPNELKRLAEVVYPSKDWVIGNQTDPVYGQGSIPVVHVKDYPNWFSSNLFSPSLTGEDWQKAQALDVILAAFNIAPEVRIAKHDNDYICAWNNGNEHTSAGFQPDILTAAARALLGSKE